MGSERTFKFIQDIFHCTDEEQRGRPEFCQRTAGGSESDRGSAPDQPDPEICNRFPTSDIASMKNAIVIPHLGASTEESEDNCAIMAVKEIKDYLENGNIHNSVNYPNCDMGVCKICHACHDYSPEHTEHADQIHGNVRGSGHQYRKNEQCNQRRVWLCDHGSGE